ncbi:MAG: histidine phosphatase family protein [Bacteroidetes bacterium]|nr:histidine phosphatase family protein [Bacteroidota bacterium]
MKSVLLIRHTKSDWNSSPADFDRPIREDRKEDTRLIAKEIRKKGFKPDYIAASPARRTLQTAKIICDEWDYKFADIVQDRSLYESSTLEILSHLQGLDKKPKNAVVICHNPSITDFVNRYTNTGVDNVPTTGAVLITFDTDDWRSIDAGGKLEWFLKPKELRK